MPLREDYKDQYDGVFTPTLPETHTIHSLNDWGYGSSSNHVPSSAYPVAATIDGVAATFVTAAPTAGQIRVNYAPPTKTGFWECHSSDNGKALVITNYTAMGSLFTAEDINRLHAAVNAVEGAGGSGVAPLAVLSPADKEASIAININLTATWNKWVDDSVAGKMKVYPTATNRVNDTSAIEGTLTRTSNKVMTFNPTSDLAANRKYYARILAGLNFADGSTLATPVDWEFTIGGIGTAAPFTKYASNPVFSALGSGNELIVAHPDIKYDIANSKYYMMYAASPNTFSNPGEVPKVAESTDLINWTRTSTDTLLALGTAGQADENRVTMPSWVRDDDEADANKRYKMWYTATAGSGVNSLGYATAPAIAGPWTKQGFCTGLADFFIGGSVVKAGSTLYMVYGDGPSDDLGLAKSTNGTAWTKVRKLVVRGGAATFDESRVAYGTLLYQPGFATPWTIFYTAKNAEGAYSIGRAQCTDIEAGAVTKDAAAIVTVGAGGTWDAANVYFVTSTIKDNKVYLGYNGIDGSAVTKIGIASN